MTAANVGVLAVLARDVSDGAVSLDRAVVFAQVAVGASLIAFGGLNWALDGAAAPVAAVLRLRGTTGRRARCRDWGTGSADGLPAAEIRFRDVTFAYPRTEREVLRGLDLTIPAGSSLAIVGQNGAGKTTIAKLLCRLYDPTSGAIEVDGTDLRDLDVVRWRSRVAAVFQDFIRFELPLRDNVAPDGAADKGPRRPDRGRRGHLAPLDTVLSTLRRRHRPVRRAVAAGRAGARRARRTLGAGVVLLDEPTAQLDVRGEAQIFERLLEATRGVTTILVSHRFSTVRHVDRICVVEDGRVIELGTHDELMAARRAATARCSSSRRSASALTPTRRGWSTMSSGAHATSDALPAALSSMWRMLKRGYRRAAAAPWSSFGLLDGAGGPAGRDAGGSGSNCSPTA